MPTAIIDKQKEPNSFPQQWLTTFHTTNASKVEQIGPQSFASSTIFTSPDANYHFFKYINNFLQGKYFHNHQDAKDAFQEFIKSWSMGFYAIGINTYSLLAKMC